MTIASVLEVLIVGDSRPLTASLAQASAATKGFGATVGTSSQLAKSGLGAVGLTAGAAGVAVGLFAASAVKAAYDYDEAFGRIDAITNATAERIGQMREEVLTLAGETAQAPVELADAFYYLASAGLSVEEQNEALAATAQASMVGLGEAADIARINAQALNAYAESGITATEVTDAMVAAVREGTAEPEQFADALGRVLPVAAKAGIEFEQVTASLATMSNAGLDVHEGVTAIRAVMQSLLAPTNQTHDALNALGLTAEQVRDSLAGEGLIATLRMLEEAAGGDIDVLRDLIPNIRGMVGAFNLTGQEAAEVDRIFREVAESGGDLSEAVGAKQQNDAFRMAQAWGKIKIEFQSLAATVLPALATGLGAVAAAAEPLLKLLLAISAVVATKFVATRAVGWAMALGDSFAILATRLADAGRAFTATGSLAEAAGAAFNRNATAIGTAARALGSWSLLLGTVFATGKMVVGLLGDMTAKFDEVAEATGLSAELFDFASDKLDIFGAVAEGMPLEGIIAGLDGAQDQMEELIPITEGLGSTLMNMGISGADASNILGGAMETSLNGTNEGLLLFQQNAQGSINWLKSQAQAFRDGDLTLFQYRNRIEDYGISAESSFGLVNAILDKHGKRLLSTGDVVTNFARMTADDVEEWRGSVIEDFQATFGVIGGADDVFKSTTQSFLKGLREMRNDAIRAARNLEELAEMKAVPDEFIVFLQTQGPGAIDDFVNATREGQREAIRIWREYINQGVEPAIAATDQLSGMNVKIGVDDKELTNLQNRLRNIKSSYFINVGVHTVPLSPWPDEALKMHLIDPMKAMGFTQKGKEWHLPVLVDVHSGDGFSPGAAPGFASGRADHTRRRGDHRSLDRQRFEEDFAYTREYQGPR